MEPRTFPEGGFKSVNNRILLTLNIRNILNMLRQMREPSKRVKTDTNRNFKAAITYLGGGPKACEYRIEPH